LLENPFGEEEMLRFISFLLGKPYEPCKGCEVYKEQLKIMQRNQEALLDQIITITKPEVKIVSNQEAPKPITPKYVPWSVTQRKLELEDREKARQAIMNDAKRQNPDVADKIEKLEEELGVEDASNQS
jgi:hypothetical protein